MHAQYGGYFPHAIAFLVDQFASVRDLCFCKGRARAKLHTSRFRGFTALLGMVKPIRPAGVVVSAQGSSSDPAGCGCYGPSGHPQGNRMSQILGLMRHRKTISACLILTWYILGK